MGKKDYWDMVGPMEVVKHLWVVVAHLVYTDQLQNIF